MHLHYVRKVAQGVNVYLQGGTVPTPCAPYPLLFQNPESATEVDLYRNDFSCRHKMISDCIKVHIRKSYSDVGLTNSFSLD